MDQTKHTIEIQDHEFVDLEMIKLLSRVCAFCEEKGHVIMDYPFVPFHVGTCIVRHVELQNVARIVIDQP